MRCLKPYDVFLSHVAEDWDLVEPLVGALRKAGLRVWYSRDKLLPGESILSGVEKGLKQSRFGIVVLSKAYVGSKWATYELFASIARQDGNKPVCIPVWHNISSEEIRLHFPVSIVDLYGITTKHGIDHVVTRLRQTVASRSKFCKWVSHASWLIHTYSRLARQMLAVFVVSSIAAAVYLYIMSSYTPGHIVHPAIRSRIAKAERLCAENTGANTDSAWQFIKEKRGQFDGFTTQGGNRNPMYFMNGTREISSRAALQRLGIPVDRATVEGYYGLNACSAYIIESSFSSNAFVMDYLICNEEPVQYEIIDAKPVNEDECHVTVRYSAFVRCVEVYCNYIYRTKSRLQTITYRGLLPVETFVFKKKEGQWKLAAVN